jgi:hypothetical protein
MHPPVSEAEAVDGGPHFLGGDDILVIDHVEQFIKHMGFSHI